MPRPVIEPKRRRATGAYVPPGWPPNVPPPAVEGWEQAAVEWLLAWGAPEWQGDGYETLRRQPLVLEWLFCHRAKADLEATRTVWRELARPHEGDDDALVAQHRRALERVGGELKARAQAGALIERTLRGELFVSPL